MIIDWWPWFYHKPRRDCRKTLFRDFCHFLSFINPLFTMIGFFKKLRKLIILDFFDSLEGVKYSVELRNLRWAGVSTHCELCHHFVVWKPVRLQFSIIITSLRDSRSLAWHLCSPTHTIRNQRACARLAIVFPKIGVPANRDITLVI